MISANHEGIPATSPARRSRGIDFVCGVHSSFPSGTFANAPRVRAPSRSSWSEKNCVSFIIRLYHRILLDDRKGQSLQCSPGSLSIIDSTERKQAMFNWSRRDFLRAAVVAPAISAAPRLAAQRPSPGPKLKVQFTPGGHTSPLQMYAMFTDAMFEDVDTTVLPHPRAFDSIGSPSAPDVIVTNDWITGGWPESDRAKMVKHLDAGK